MFGRVIVTKLDLAQRLLYYVQEPQQRFQKVT